MAEKRYIEINRLINDLNKFAPEAFNALINSIILNQPNADVQEVRHGRWIKIEGEFFSSTDGRSGNVVKCSMCGEPSSCGLSTPYCSICGAKMDSWED